METLTCNHCGASGTFTANDTDRFCRKCGTPFFVPLDSVTKETEWTDAYNSFYNYDNLLSPALTYAVSRYANWKYGITQTSRMLRGQGEAMRRFDRAITMHQSFMRSGYALRMVEERLSNKTPSSHKSKEDLLSEGTKAIKEAGSELFNDVWNTYSEKETTATKREAGDLLTIAVAITEGDLDTNLLFPKIQMEEIFGGIVSDLSSWHSREFGKTTQEDVDQITADVIFGHSLRIAETICVS